MLIGEAIGNIVLAEIDPIQNTFSKKSLSKPANTFVQGSNFVEINNDGDIDIFACNDDGESSIWGKNGSGRFIDLDSWIDMSLNGDSGEAASGNYGSHLGGY